ncbi:hypothetical protein B0O80DRAFT_459389 [Mortierella sp. GBAus27b]|nr:hypothetical protein B0O80DRAFT_459389 [Mortierella sp. GBAus27b]
MKRGNLFSTIRRPTAIIRKDSPWHSTMACRSLIASRTRVRREVSMDRLEHGPFGGNCEFKRKSSSSRRLKNPAPHRTERDDPTHLSLFKPWYPEFDARSTGTYHRVRDTWSMG